VSRLRVQSFALSIDGYGACPRQDLPAPVYECAKTVAGERATHVFLRQRLAHPANRSG
jgi:hypothetical protein